MTTNDTDLAIIAKTAVEKLNRSLAKTSLDDLLLGARRSLLIVDCSGSMGEYIADGSRKIDALRKVVANLRAVSSVPVAAFGHRSERSATACELVDSIPEPSGLTPLHRAIDFGAAEGANHLVVVTDGEPDSEAFAFAAATRFAGPIDVIYIGDGTGHGAHFAKELSRRTGGECSLTDLGKPKELAGKIRLLLGDGN